jgi:formylglycine-generating enzyme required for sulfatase activity
MKSRVLRGGSHVSDTWDLRSTFRSWLVPGDRVRYGGFRIVIRSKQIEPT